MEIELQPLINLDELVNGAKDIIKKYADMGDANFIMLNEVVNGKKPIATVNYVDCEQELTEKEKKFMQTVIEKMVTRGVDKDNEDSFRAFQESKIMSKHKSNGGKKRSNKHSKKRSKKNRGRRTTSHRRRSRARV